MAQVQRLSAWILSLFLISIPPAYAWEETLNQSIPDVVVYHAIGNNGSVGIRIGNRSDYHINFFDPHTGVNFCQYAVDPQVYFNGNPRVAAAKTDNLFLAAFYNRTTVNGPQKRLKVLAFRVNEGQTQCNPVWEWNAPFTMNTNTIPTFKVMLSASGDTAVLFTNNDPSLIATRLYSFDINNGAVLHQTNTPIPLSFNDDTAGMSPNGRYVLIGQPNYQFSILPINPANKQFGAPLPVGSYFAGTVGNEGTFIGSGWNIPNGSTTYSLIVKYRHVDPQYPDYVQYLVGFTYLMSAETPVCKTVAISENEQVGVVACNNQTNNRVKVQSFAVKRSIMNGNLYPINSVEATSQSTNQFLPFKATAANRGTIAVLTTGDGGNGLAPELIIMPPFSPAQLFQASGSGIDIVAGQDNIWPAFHAAHMNESANSNSIFREYTNTH